MKVALTKGLCATVDKEDFAKVNKFKWHVFAQKGYAGRDERKGGNKRKILMHRFILNAPKGLEVDHINGNPLDNRKSNLRLCTHQQNCSNHKGYSKHKGVYKIKNRPLNNPYVAQIMVDGKHVHIGYFRTLEEAMKARDKKAKEILGPFANLSL